MTYRRLTNVYGPLTVGELKQILNGVSDDDLFVTIDGLGYTGFSATITEIGYNSDQLVLELATRREKQ